MKKVELRTAIRMEKRKMFKTVNGAKVKLLKLPFFKKEV